MDLDFFFHELTDPWPEALCLTDVTGRILAINPAGEKILGLTRGKGVGRSLTEFAAGNRSSVTDYLALCAANRQQIPGALTFTSADGRPRRYRCLGYRFRPDSAAQAAVLLRFGTAQNFTSGFIRLNQTLARQRQAHRELLASHTRLQSVLDSLEAIVYVADMESYEILFINRYCRELLGNITGEICWQTLQAGQAGPCSFCTNSLLLNQDGSPADTYRWEFRNTRNNRWYYILDKAIPWLDGRLVRLEIATDITEQKTAEIERALQAERIESLLTLSQTSWQSERELINHALAEVIHLTGSEVGYLHFLDGEKRIRQTFSLPDDLFAHCPRELHSRFRQARSCIWGWAIREKAAIIHNDCSMFPDKMTCPGCDFPFRRHMGMPLFDNGRIIAVAGVGNRKEPYSRDDLQQFRLYMRSTWSILRQRQMEIDIRQAKEQWEETFNATDLAITIHDPDMRIVRANRVAAEILGVRSEDLIGRHCYDVFRQSDKPCNGCPELQTLEDLATHQATIHHPNLGRTFEVMISPLKNSDGTLVGCVQVAKDITDKLVLESRLQQAQKMEAIGTMAGGIAHDFNNILTPILGFTELILKADPPREAITGYIQTIHEAAGRAKKLVQQILTFSRQLPTEKRPLQPQPIIKETLRLLRSSLPKTIEIRTDIAADCGQVTCDPTQLQQILMNLCANAYHAMRETGGVLAIGLRSVDIGKQDSIIPGQEMETGSYVRLEVSDTGCGMSPEIREKIFEPYFTTKDKGEGTGLGLAVLHGIVRSHDGHVNVYSEPGKGSTFHVYLPRIDNEKSLSPDNDTRPVPGGSERVLVVDDEESVTELLSAILTELGYQVTVANSGEEALQLFLEAQDHFDLLLTDMTMPHLTGLDLCRQIQAVRPEMPIILCTGFSELVNREKAADLGIRCFLMKPIRLHRLATAMRTALSPRHDEDAATGEPGEPYSSRDL